MAPYCADQHGCWISAQNRNDPPVLPPDFYFKTSCSDYGCYTLAPTLPFDFFGIAYELGAQYQVATPTASPWGSLLAPGAFSVTNKYTNDNYCKLTFYTDTACSQPPTSFPTPQPLIQPPVGPVLPKSRPAHDIVLSADNCFVTNVQYYSNSYNSQLGLPAGGYPLFMQPLNDNQFSEMCTGCAPPPIGCPTVCPTLCVNKVNSGLQNVNPGDCPPDVYGLSGVSAAACGYYQMLPLQGYSSDSYFPTNSYVYTDQFQFQNTLSVGVTGNCEIVYTATGSPSPQTLSASTPWVTASANFGPNPPFNIEFEYQSPHTCYSFNSNPMTSVGINFPIPIYEVDITVRANPSPVGTNDDAIMSRDIYPEMCAFTSISYVWPSLPSFTSSGPVQLAFDTSVLLSGLYFSPRIELSTSLYSLHQCHSLRSMPPLPNRLLPMAPTRF